MVFKIFIVTNSWVIDYSYFEDGHFTRCSLKDSKYTILTNSCKHFIIIYRIFVISFFTWKKLNIKFWCDTKVLLFPVK